jgi:hypothetical protein
MTYKSLTSGTILILMPGCRCRAGTDEMTNSKNADATPSLTFTAAFHNAKPNLVEDDNEGEVNGGSCEGGQQARLGEQLILPSQPAP